MQKPHNSSQAKRPILQQHQADVRNGPKSLEKSDSRLLSGGQEGHVSKNPLTPYKDTMGSGATPRGSGQNTGSRDLSCFYCGGKGHFKRDCPLLKPKEYPRKEEVKKDTYSGHGQDLKETRPHNEDQFGRGRGHKYAMGRGRGTGYKAGTRQDHTQATGRGRGRDVSLYDQFTYLPPFLDTHCHVEYLMERLRIHKYSELARRHCYPGNYDGCVTSFCDPAGLSSLSQADQLLAEGNIWASYGMHPHHASYLTDTLEDKLISRLKEPKCVAFGEIGLDYSEHSLQQSGKDKQTDILKRLLSMAPIFDKPILLHCRDADDDLYPILKASVPPSWRIHLHCYTGSLEMALKFTTDFPNLYVGVTGHVTYNKFRQTRQVVRTLPLERILIETDAPYMPPAGTGERWSHPPMVAYVAEEIAKSRQISIEEVILETRKNAKDIYGI